MEYMTSKRVQEETLKELREIRKLLEAAIPKEPTPLYKSLEEEEPQSIGWLQLSTRTTNALRRTGINTIAGVREFASQPPEMQMKTNFIGEASVKEIAECLHLYDQAKEMWNE